MHNEWFSGTVFKLYTGVNYQGFLGGGEAFPGGGGIWQ